MLVTFISQCEKRSLKKTRRILDSFANRIGTHTWQTTITQEGLLTVKTLLRQSATRHTAVSCHWHRGVNHTELLWVVGNHNQFDEQGYVPVNRTKKNMLHNEWENDWNYLPIIKSLTALSALLHDWGKANDFFQKKLIANSKESQRKGDPYRHEWISCLLMTLLVKYSGDSDDDSAWLTLLTNTMQDKKLERFLKTEMATFATDAHKNKKYTFRKQLVELPPIAQLITWLILSHHRLPCPLKTNNYIDTSKETFSDLFKGIDSTWGYDNLMSELDKDETRYFNKCFSFSSGFLLTNAEKWRAQLIRWSTTLLSQKEELLPLIDTTQIRLILSHARLSMMLGDHFYSSQPQQAQWPCSSALYANTNKERNLKQHLDEHLIYVCKNALAVCQYLPAFTQKMESVFDIKFPKSTNTRKFAWQDNAVKTIKTQRQQLTGNVTDYGWFIVNMASTGRGKTIANAKIMQALSEDSKSLRYILALGLRTLTMQTGDEYRQSLKMTEQDVAVLIGSSVIEELHNERRSHNSSADSFGSESMETLLREDFDTSYESVKSLNAPFLETILTRSKDQALLYSPVLVCTIDHIIKATETQRGGRYILPYLRLLSSDLVIDEVDDFNQDDLIAIGRLIHLSGMLGHKVAISSATIPPAVAEGLFACYQSGWHIHSQLHNKPATVVATWIDEFKSETLPVRLDDSHTNAAQVYCQAHRRFAIKRLEKLAQQPAKQRGTLINCEVALHQDEETSKCNSYYEQIKSTVCQLHQAHHYVDEKSQKTISFGVIRVANISPCVALSHYLLNCQWPENFTPKIMTYHSRQLLLLRHEQEQHLDSVLKRKKGYEQALADPIIQQHIRECKTDNLVYILVATPVEEVGRDHDFDWAIIEPSSLRSIIQMAGRVKRHREEAVSTANIALLQYNHKGLLNKTPAFACPGFESGTQTALKLNSHDLFKLVDEQKIAERIDASARVISPPLELAKKGCDSLAELEHKALTLTLNDPDRKGPKGLPSWCNDVWWLTSLPQRLTTFRKSMPQQILYYRIVDQELRFYEKNSQGDFIDSDWNNYIKSTCNEALPSSSRLWLPRNYEQSIYHRANALVSNNDQEAPPEMTRLIRKLSSRYGEITLPLNNQYSVTYYDYNDNYGLTKHKDNSNSTQE